MRKSTDVFEYPAQLVHVALVPLYGVDVLRVCDAMRNRLHNIMGSFQLRGVLMQTGGVLDQLLRNKQADTSVIHQVNSKFREIIKAHGYKLILVRVQSKGHTL